MQRTKLKNRYNKNPTELNHLHFKKTKKLLCKPAEKGKERILHKSPLKHLQR